MTRLQLFQRAARLGFWAYVATVMGAGFWGIFGARVDFPLLLEQPLDRLDNRAIPNVLSQYRFLRGLEAGFGLYATTCQKEVFEGGSRPNRLFVSAMALGILGRTVSRIGDGKARPIMQFFLYGELAAWTAIVAVTRPWRRPGSGPSEREEVRVRPGGDGPGH